MREVDRIRKEHEQHIATAQDMLRVARKLPSDAPIRRSEALKLVTGGHDTEELLIEIDRLVMEIMK